MVDLPWSVVEVEAGRFDDFTDFSGLVDLAVEVDDFLLSVFFFHEGGTESV